MPSSVDFSSHYLGQCHLIFYKSISDLTSILNSPIVKFGIFFSVFVSLKFALISTCNRKENLIN